MRPTAQNAKGHAKYLQKINKFIPEKFMFLGKTTRSQMGSKFYFRPDKTEMIQSTHKTHTCIYICI